MAKHNTGKDLREEKQNDELRIALLQHVPVPGDTTSATQRIEKFAVEAASAGCSLLLVPECSVTGYNQPLNAMQQVALRDDDETQTAIARVCVQHSLSIAYGFAEKDKDFYYNTVQVISETGELSGKYRKTHLWGELDRELFTEGSELSPVFTINGWQIGLLICYDIEFPEAARTLALAGAELILVPTGLMHPWRDVAERVVPVRAYENQLYIAYCNYCGSEADLDYEGRSCIVGPDGSDLARAEQSQVLLTATLTRSAIEQNRQALPYHRDRRPGLYHSLSKGEVIV